MIQQLVDRYDKKGLKSSVIITSSIAGQYPLCGISTYSAVKAFVTHLSHCLNYEFKGKVDILSYSPGFVSTKMSNAMETNS